MANPVGSVTAKIILDTSEFESAIKDLKGEVDSIKQTFNKKTGGNNGLLDDVKKLKEEIDSLREKNENYKKTLKELREQNADYAKGIENLNNMLEKAKKGQDNFNKGLKDGQKNLDNAAKSASNYIKLADRMTKLRKNNLATHLYEWGRGDLTWLSTGATAGGRHKYGDFSQWIKQINKGNVSVSNLKRKFETLTETQMKWESSVNSAYRKAIEGIKQYDRQVKESMVAEQRRWSQTGGITGYINLINQMRQATNTVTNATLKRIPEITNIFKQLEGTVKRLYSYTVTEEGELVNPQLIARSTEVLKKFDFQVLETARHLSEMGKAVPGLESFEKRISTLASRMQKLTVQGSPNWQGRNVTGGYSTYLSNVTKINEALTKQQRIARETKLANEGLSQAYNKTGINLNTYRANLTKIQEGLEQTRLRTAQLEAAQQSLYYKGAKNNLGTYKANMQQINEQVARQVDLNDKNTKSLKSSSTASKSLGSQIRKSGEYANSLYRGFQKVRSMIISIKTIAGALGTMAVWNFAFDLVDKAKETYKAKNEMESLLDKNSKVDVTGQKEFNKALDKTVQRFQKINKYSLGETAASVGLEFNLNGKEMAKSLDVLAMIQSEYVRAGRTTEEAALAVKDILQGEFQRLSRETGIGKKDLIALGWSGKNEDIQGMMDALEKAGKSRHWDLFAEKATSVGDVVTITQSRFSEFGANLITEIEPMIVGAFNGIINAIDGVSKAFNGMSSFGKMATIGFGGTGALVGVASLFMSISKGIGLADIATIGFGRSLGSMIFKLNTAKVAQYGFLKTLMASISGTDVASVANVRFTKVLAGRILGVKQETVATHGLLSALVARKMELKGELNVMNSSIVATGNLRQKLIYLAKGEIVANKEGATWGKTLKSLITSTKLLRLAVLGLGAGLAVLGLASIYDWTDKIKKNISKFNTVLSDGDNMVAKAKTKWDNYKESLSKVSDTTSDYYKRLKANRDIAKGNYEDLTKANKLAKQYDYEIKQYGKSIMDRKNSRMTETLQKAGLSYADATEKVSNYTGAVEKARNAELRAYKVEDDRLISASKHINSRIEGMKKEDDARLSQVTNEKERVKLEKELTQKRIDYAQEYTTVASEAAEHWKEFYKGNISAGIYALGDELRLIFVDLWHNNHFRTFWLDIQNTWKTVKPTVDEIIKRLGDLGNTLLDFGHGILSTDIGKWGVSLAGVGVIIGGLAYKFRKPLGTLKDLGKTIWGRIKDFKGLGKSAEEAAEQMDKTGTTTSTGGINGDVGGETSGKLTTDLKEIGKNRLKSFANNALIIAEGMALVTEAILLIKAPMGALSEVGQDFKRLEPNIREGIEGLKVVAPVIGAILIPIIALHQVLSRFGGFMSSWGDLISNLKAFATMALGIAEGMVLVTEAIYLLKLPLWSLGEVGKDFISNKVNVDAGVEAMKTIAESLQYLLPFVPALAGGILLAIAIFESGPIGLALSLAVVGGVALGIGLVAEAILALKMPLWSIGELGKDYNGNLDNVRAGAEAIKLTAEALGYVADAMTSLTLVDLNLLGQLISEVVSNWLGTDLNGKLSDLTAEGGVIPQLNDFAKAFNKFEFEPIQQDKVTALAAAGDGVKTIGDAMVKVKDAMNNLPDEFKNPQSTTALTYDPKTNATSVAGSATDSVSSYFDTFKEPLRQLKSFVYEFNNNDEFNIEPIDTDRVSNINKAADMIETINTAVEKVKTTMQNVGDSGSATAFAEGGWFGQAGYNLLHMTGIGSMNNGQGSGDYKSSLGSSLKEMEDVISDLFTFQTNVSKYGGEGGEGTDVSSLTNMVTIIQDAIGKVAQSLSDAVPTFKDKGKSLSGAIVSGFNEGSAEIKGMATTLVNKIANGIMNTKDTLYNTANSLGKTTATNFKNGVAPMSDYMANEMKYTNDALNGDMHDVLGQSAYNLGQYVSDQYKNGLDMHSPGKMARSTEEEVGYIGDALSNGITNLPQMAYDLANSLTSNFNIDFGLSNIKLPNITNFTNQLSVIPSTVGNIKTQVSTKFNEMQTGIGGAFNNILTKTRTSMSGMKNATISHIGNIKTSWKGMQNALIASAEHIKTQTTTKIDKLKTNLGQFWNKLKHPDQLIGSAGGHKGSIKRHYAPKLPKLYAGGDTSPSAKDKSFFEQYMKCLLTEGNCYAGGWSFNWNKDIQSKFNGWNTHFGKWHLDSNLNVGKFNNSNFPVRNLPENARASIAKSYIFDTIAATSYSKYFNSNFGDDPVAALLSGSFNCWDGTNVVLALASAFGFTGGGMGHGTWNGINHVWANIPGLGIIDPTAIQQNRSFTSSAVKGYHAGGSRSSSNTDGMGKVVHNHGDTVVNINAPVYGVEELDKAIENGVKKANRKLFRNNYSGV